ncbi:MAG: endolytic transglycosylase MltG [Desulfobacterales bacterium]|nr:endolytic transglycosylase MltG [Desulfobacterales bacterium]
MIIKKKYAIGAALILMLIFLSSLAFYYHRFSEFIQTPVDPQSDARPFFIKPGQGLKTIAKNLETDGIISNHTYFTWLAKLKKTETRLQAGEYQLSGAHSPEQILDILLKGKVKLHRVTIPEGLTIVETAKIFENEGFSKASEFIRLCSDPSFIQSLGVDAPTLEGYLFPNTYFFPKGTDAQTIISTLVDHLNQVLLTPEWRVRAKELGFSMFEIITLASIIEKETGDASERPIISSVFHNRLQINMRLQSDPTVIYGIKDFDGNIRRIHLNTPTPYNTYQIKGLPVGPIANPGALSIQAALYPDQTDYLYFVSKKDTTHYFSKTLKEHNRAVRKYQLNKQ